MTEKTFKVISKESRTGVSRTGKPYCFEYLIVNFNGTSCSTERRRSKGR